MARQQASARHVAVVFVQFKRRSYVAWISDGGTRCGRAGSRTTCGSPSQPLEMPEMRRYHAHTLYCDVACCVGCEAGCPDRCGHAYVGSSA
jgi:hypothetical protein